MNKETPNGSELIPNYIQCNSCSDVNIPAISWCVECEELICYICVDAHRRLKATKNHKIKTNHEIAETVIKCKSCSDDATADSWCYDCSDFICGNCVRAHQRIKTTKNHTIKSKAMLCSQLADHPISSGSRNVINSSNHSEEISPESPSAETIVSIVSSLIESGGLHSIDNNTIDESAQGATVYDAEPISIHAILNGPDESVEYDRVDEEINRVLAALDTTAAPNFLDEPIPNLRVEDVLGVAEFESVLAELNPENPGSSTGNLDNPVHELSMEGVLKNITEAIPYEGDDEELNRVLAELNAESCLDTEEVFLYQKSIGDGLSLLLVIECCCHMIRDW